MPHSCVKCNQILPDQSESVLNGCSCGSRIFYFVKTDAPFAPIKFKTEEKANIDETKQDSTIQIPEQLIELSKNKVIVIDQDGPENIKVLEPGSYELNVAALFKGDPVILKTDADVYYVKLPAPKKQK